MSCYIFQSLSHFEFIFVHSVTVCSGSIDLHFSNYQRCSAFFHVLAHFSIGWLAFLLLSCISCLYILEIKLLSVASFETIFSHSVSCLFVFSLVSFVVKKLVR